MVPLAPKEFNIIGVFLKNPNKVLSNENLIQEVWGKNKKVNSRTLHSYIRTIRKKMRTVEYPIDLHLTTVWGIGYRWDSLEEISTVNNVY
ncbi:winged helix-turn-helix domain-containing protein [Bacillus coreaensis]